MYRTRVLLTVVLLAALAVLASPAPVYAAQFKVGFAQCDITPEKPTPMWGYGARHQMLSKGVRDPLKARALVIDDGQTKLAIVGMDIGRAPTTWMMPTIREAVKTASGIEHVMIAGSHTHHGPVIELQDQEDKGKGVYDDAISYAQQLPQKLIAVINEAAAAEEDAQIGWASTEVNWNRNRHSRIEPKPVDKELCVVRFDNRSGQPIALLVNFAAHPTNLDELDLQFSCEYPGFLAAAVEQGLNTHCVFMQGASGDMSCNKPAEADSIEAFGKMLGEEAVKLAKTIQTNVPEKPSLQVVEDELTFGARLDLQNKALQNIFKTAFFPELISALDELDGNTIHAPMTTALINGELAFVTGPGEFFCNHSIRLKERCHGVKALFFGYCNGHCMYFPTIEAASEGGYGADATVSWVELGAGEAMMNRGLINIYTMMGKYPPPMPVLTEKK